MYPLLDATTRLRPPVMRLLLPCLLALFSSGISGTQITPKAIHDTGCTVTASGGDDAPHFLHAVKHCKEVIIPKHTTLNIATRLNMTGVADKHIVNLFLRICITSADDRVELTRNY